MLRALILYLSRAAWARRIVTHWPVARPAVLRFVAGETLEGAVSAVRRLSEQGIDSTVALLGEQVHEAAQARAMVAGYCELIDALHAARSEPQGGRAAWASLKLTALGIDIDADLCRDNLCQILACARAEGRDTCITIDMEEYGYVQPTLDLYRSLRNDEGFHNLRVVIQAYLYRSEEDIRQLAAEGAGVRLCKGAYKEPASVAHPKKRDVDQAYVRLMKVLLDAAQDGRGYPALATHDERIIEEAKAYAAARGVPPDAYEFQMLYGVRTALQQRLVAEGYRVRVYVPYGREWYPYFMRRLAERPANLWFFASNFFRR